MNKVQVLRGILNDPKLIEVGRMAIEDILIEFRDSGLAAWGRGNGFTVKEKDGSPSSIIRLGTPEGIRIALEAMIKELGSE